MRDLEQARALLRAAERDLAALRGMADAATFADEVFGFHAQQSAEKALKAWLAAQGVPYPRTHDVGHLLRLLQERGIDIVSLEALVEYNPYAVQYRYEAFETEDEPLDRTTAVAQVGALLERVARYIAETEVGRQETPSPE